MTAWLDPLRSTLDLASNEVRFFFRDDDGGWGDDALLRLLDLFAGTSAPVDVAVIPTALGASLAAELGARLARGLLGVHQHGFAHANHEVEGRKCEFGPSRAREAQRRDIFEGQRLLRQVLGDGLDPIFTPPWNRCCRCTADALVEAGIVVLSRDGTAPRFDRADLAEIPIAIDWLAHRKGVRLSREDLGTKIAGAAASASTVGIMLHHAVMDEADLRGVGELLTVLSTHSRARCVRMLAAAQQLPR